MDVSFETSFFIVSFLSSVFTLVTMRLDENDTVIKEHIPTLDGKKLLMQVEREWRSVR
jgi:hypothetical protein